MFSKLVVALALCQTVFGLTGSISSASAKYSIGDTVPLNGTLQFDLRLEHESRQVALQFSAGDVTFTQWPVSGGSGDYRLKMAVSKFPAYLRSFDSIDAELVVGDAKQIYPVATIRPVVKAEAPEVVRFAKKPEIHHVFRNDATQVPRAISQAFVVAALVLLGTLFAAWARFDAVNVRVGLDKYVVGLLVTILAYEGSFFGYFVGSSIFATLERWALLLPFGVFFGIKSLRILAQHRKAGRR